MFPKTGGRSKRDFCKGFAEAKPPKIVNFPEFLGTFSWYIYYNKIVNVFAITPTPEKIL